MPEQLRLRCASVRENDNYFSMFFNQGADVPSVLVRLPKSSRTFQEGKVYLVTITEAPAE